jgi:hypothetical protein
MFAWRGARLAAIALGVALVVTLVIGAFTFWPVPVPQAHGKRLDVAYSEVKAYDRGDKLVTRASYSENRDNILAVLTVALGAAASKHVTKDFQVATTIYRWKGLELESYRVHRKNYNTISVEAARVNGVAVVALGGYQVGGEFPGAGAYDICALHVEPPTLAGFIASLSPPRINAIESPDKKDVVGIFEDYTRHGVIAGFQAPQFGEGC